MTALGLLLLAVSVADLLAGGLGARPDSGVRSVVGVAGTTAAAALAGIAVGISHPLLLGVLVLVTAGPWIGLRVVDPSQPGPALLALGLSGVIALAVLPLLPEPDFGGVGTWLASSSLPVLAGTTPPVLLLGAGVLLFLTASANGVVRAVLLSAVQESQVRASEGRLLGGRIIGPLERILIFGLALAGEPTAAALVISAKSIVRFPELARSASSPTDGPAEADVVTEYFLLGSLTSWGLALLPALLFIR